MFSFVKKLMLGQKMQFNEGEILLLDEPICLMPIRTVMDTTANAKAGKRNAIYLAGKTSGAYWFEKITKRFYQDKMPAKDIIEWGNNIIAMAGYGISVLEKVNFDDKEIIFRLNNSTMFRIMGKSKKPIDDLYRGFVAGAGTVMLKEECDAVEIKCRAVDGDFCRFIVKPKGKFDRSDPVVKEQLEQ